MGCNFEERYNWASIYFYSAGQVLFYKQKFQLQMGIARYNIQLMGCNFEERLGMNILMTLSSARMKTFIQDTFQFVHTDKKCIFT